MFNSLKQLKKINNSKLSDDEWYETDTNGRGVIDVGAENYEDIFSYYDLEGENVLDKEFDEFLESKADAIPLKQEIAIHFHVKNANDSKCEEMDRAIKNHYKRELRALNRKLHKTNLFTLYMFFMGLVCTALHVVTTEVLNLYHVIPYLIDIAAWVFLWETIDQFFLHRRKIKRKMLKKFRFIRADISLYEYKTNKKKQPIKFGKNAKSLNKILASVDKDNKKIEKQIEKMN